MSFMNNLHISETIRDDGFYCLKKNQDINTHTWFMIQKGPLQKSVSTSISFHVFIFQHQGNIIQLPTPKNELAGGMEATRQWTKTGSGKSNLDGPVVLEIN